MQRYAKAMGTLGDMITTGLLLTWDWALIDTGHPVLTQPDQRRVHRPMGKVIADLSLPKDSVPQWEDLTDEDFLYDLAGRIGGRMGEEIERLGRICEARGWVEEAEKNLRYLEIASVRVNDLHEPEEQGRLVARLRPLKSRYLDKIIAKAREGYLSHAGQFPNWKLSDAEYREVCLQSTLGHPLLALPQACAGFDGYRDPAIALSYQVGAFLALVEAPGYKALHPLSFDSEWGAQDELKTQLWHLKDPSIRFIRKEFS